MVSPSVMSCSPVGGLSFGRFLRVYGICCLFFTVGCCFIHLPFLKGRLAWNWLYDHPPKGILAQMKDKKKEGFKVFQRPGHTRTPHMFTLNRDVSITSPVFISKSLQSIRPELHGANGPRRVRLFSGYRFVIYLVPAATRACVIRSTKTTWLLVNNSGLKGEILVLDSYHTYHIH